jgi:hypothetical protein
MSIVSGLIDTSCVFKYKKKIVPTNGVASFGAEPPSIIRDAGVVGSASKFKTFTPASLSVEGNPLQSLKDSGNTPFYTSRGSKGPHLPAALNNGDPTTNSKKYDELAERLNEAPPLRMYNGAAFNLPAGFISR